MNKNNHKLTIIATAEMGPGTFEAKFIPLSKVNCVDKIYVLRKSKGPSINKLNYLIVPKIFTGKLIGLFIRPLLLLYYTIKLKANLILAYHFVPHGFFALITSKLTKRKFIMCQTGLFAQNYVSQQKVLGKLILKTAKSAYVLNVPGKNSFNFWRDHGVDENSIRILHSTIDINRFKPMNLDKKYDFIILSRLAPVKNISMIIEALEYIHKKRPEIKTVVVGDGEEKNSLQNLVKSKKMENYIEFVSYQKNPEYWYNISKIYVMASLSEGLPTSLMQAMACELIVISSNVGNIQDIICDNDNGYLIKLKDVNDLIELMLFTLSKYSESKKIKKNARIRIIEHHSYESAIFKWENLLENSDMRGKKCLILIE